MVLLRLVSRRGCLALLAVGLVVACWAHALKLVTLLRPLVLEPSGLAEAAWALPERRLSHEEQEALGRDGVLLVRGLVSDARLLKAILPAMQQHEQFDEGVYLKSYNYNGAVRALLRDGPLGALAADAMRAKGAKIDGAPIWGRSEHGDRSAYYRGWHQDARHMPDMLSIWLAVTNAPHALDFVRGSHRFQAEVLRACNDSLRLGAPGLSVAEERCVRRFRRERLDPLLGRSSLLWEDLRPGDAWLFNSAVLHRGRNWPLPRLAIAARTVPFDPVNCGENSSACCRDIDVKGRVLSIYPRRRSSLACVRDRVLARPQWLWPHLDDRLPSSTPESLRWIIAALSQAAFGRSGSLRSGVLQLNGLLPESLRIHVDS
uniref:Phytanoyl-CoA dioxygenase n=1 Tax=Alexandrium catenella TaxID=2925 RepID=A0A7S1L7F1_ALECA|mmetsp:Transcript_106741/g.283964  ORF Transcript_106741/g.283964 Transcript_106741/m.283964 type:complete len:374 (+) Transcript_106741:61-1182(+)